MFDPFQLAMISLLGGVLLSFGLTHLERYRRAKAVEDGLYNELSIVRDYYINWIINVGKIDNRSGLKHTSSLSHLSVDCIDQCVFELLSLHRPLTGDQRKLVHNIKIKLANFESWFSEKDRHFSEHINSGTKGADSDHDKLLAQLIGESADIILGLNEFCRKKKKFKIDNLFYSKEDRLKVIIDLTGSSKNYAAELGKRHIEQTGV